MSWECDQCGLCCRGLAVKLILPDFYEDGKCKFLNSENKCDIYNDRPKECRVKIFDSTSEFIQVSVCRFLKEESNEMV